MIGLEQKTKQVESVSKKPFTSTALLRYIIVDGEAIKAGEATVEEFYCYVYGLLEQFCEEELRYWERFDLDWSDEANRVAAINEFNGMNRARRTCKLPLIALFV